MEIKQGVRQLKYDQETEQQDIKEGKSDAKRTMDLVVEESSKVLPGIRFTADLPECNESGRCPVLDLEVWAAHTEEGKMRIRHTFYEKAIAAPSVFHSKAAYGWRSKIVTLSEEMRRRLRNMDRLHQRKEILETTATFLQKMANSGYDKATRWEVVKSATIKHYRQLAQAAAEGRSIYRSSGEMKEGRILKGLDKTQWFRPKRGGKDKREAKEVPDIIKEETKRWAGKGRKKSEEERKEEPGTRQEGNDRQPQEGEGRRQGTVVVETVIFVPYTPQSILQEADDCLTSSMGRPRARFVDKAGGIIVTQVGRPNPWKAEVWCARGECVACQAG